jgi:hypothetical protein
MTSEEVAIRPHKNALDMMIEMMGLCRRKFN